MILQVWRAFELQAEASPAYVSMGLGVNAWRALLTMFTEKTGAASPMPEAGCAIASIPGCWCCTRFMQGMASRTDLALALQAYCYHKSPHPTLQCCFACKVQQVLFLLELRWARTSHSLNHTTCPHLRMRLMRGLRIGAHTGLLLHIRSCDVSRELQQLGRLQCEARSARSQPSGALCDSCSCRSLSRPRHTQMKVQYMVGPVSSPGSCPRHLCSVRKRFVGRHIMQRCDLLKISGC